MIKRREIGRLVFIVLFIIVVQTPQGGLGEPVGPCVFSFTLNCTIKFDDGTNPLKCFGRNNLVAVARVSYIDITCYSAVSPIKYSFDADLVGGKNIARVVNNEHWRFTFPDFHSSYVTDPKDISNASLGIYGMELIFDASPIYTGKYRFWSSSETASFYLFKEGDRPPFLLNNTRTINPIRTQAGVTIPCITWKHDAKVELYNVTGKSGVLMNENYDPRRGFLLKTFSIKDVFECRTEVPNDFVIVKDDGDWKRRNCIQLIPGKNVSCNVQYEFVYYEIFGYLDVTCWEANLLFAWPEADIIRIKCSSPYPISFDFEGILPQPNLDVRFSRDFNGSELSKDRYTWKTEVKILSTKTTSTGFYTFKSGGLYTKFYIYREEHYAPYLLNSGEMLDWKIVNDRALIPCRTWKAGTRVQLFKGGKEMKNALYDPKVGFSLQISDISQNDIFKCSTGLAGDFVSFTFKNDNVSQIPSSLNITFRDNVARCVTKALDTFGNSLKLFAYPTNSPIKTKLLSVCIYKEYSSQCEGGEGTLTESNSFRCQSTSGEKCQELSLRPSSGLVRCVNSRRNEELIVQFFTGLDGHKYSDWNLNNNENERLLSVQTEFGRDYDSEKSIGYTNDSYRFTCTAVSYLFTEPLLMYLERDGEFTIIPTVSTTENGIIKLVRQSQELEKGRQQIICFAGVWNESKWINITKEFDIRERRKPEILESPPKYIFYLGDTNRLISCEAEAEPSPTLSWSKNDGEDLAELTVPKGDGKLILQFPKIEQSHQGTYNCTARNSEGVASKSYFVTVDEPRGISKVVLAAGGTAGGILILVVIGLSVYVVFFRSRYYSNVLSDEEIDEFWKGNPKILKEGFAHEQADGMPYEKSLVITDGLVIGNELLGDGAFGQVLKGEYNGETVAVKTVKSGAEKTYIKALLSEMKIMSHLAKSANCNIVNLIGTIVTDLKKGKVFIVVEYCPLGSLENYLRVTKKTFVDLVKNDTIDYSARPSSYKNISSKPTAAPSKPSRHLDRYVNFGIESQPQMQDIELQNTEETTGRKFSTIDLLVYSEQISSGMAFLEKQKVIHGDLAARNILVCENNSVKITDFGLSRQLYHYTQYTKKNPEPLPWRWMAVESLRQMTFSSKSDVWAFGTTLWEIFTLGDCPYPGIQWHPDFIVELEQGMRMAKPKLCTSEIYNIMTECWHTNAEDRPSFSTLQKYFHKYSLSQ